MKPKVLLILFVVSAFAAQAQNTTQYPICGGAYTLNVVTNSPLCYGGQGTFALSSPDAPKVPSVIWGDNTSGLSKQASAGTYSVSVWLAGITPCSGPTSATTINLTLPEPTKVMANGIVKSPPSCHIDQAINGNNGILEVNPSGGTHQFLYKVNWDPLNSNQFVQGQYERLGVGEGTYVVSVKDDNGCLGSDTMTVTQPLKISLSVIPVHPSCQNQMGSATVSTTYGSPPFEYAIIDAFNLTDTIVKNSSGNFQNLPEGTYLAAVRDSKGCSESQQFNIVSPSQLTIQIVKKEAVKCFGGDDGSLIVSRSGGTPNYITKVLDSQDQVLLTNSSGLGTINFTRKLPVGNFKVFFLDHGGNTSACYSDTLSFEITDTSSAPTSPLSITNLIQDACYRNGNTGRIDVNAAGGFSPYRYALRAGNYVNTPSNWIGSNAHQNFPTPYPQYDPFFSSLSSNGYTISVLDSKGCEIRSYENVGQLADFVIGIQSINNVDCNGNNTGEVLVTVNSGGVTPYSFKKRMYPSNYEPDQTSSTFSSLSAGEYYFQATDFRGCQSNELFKMISEPQPLSLIKDYQEDEKCYGQGARIGYTISGGTLNYNVYLDGNLVRTISSIPYNKLQNVARGNHLLKVIDGNGCETSPEISFEMIGPVTPGAPPNTNVGITTSIDFVEHIKCPGLSTGKIHLGIQGGWPAIDGYTIDIYSVTTYIDRIGVTRTVKTLYRTTSNPLIENLPAGTFEIRIRDSFGCQKIHYQNILQPDPISASFNGISGNCGVGGPTVVSGGVTLNEINGGTREYTYYLNGIYYSTSVDPLPKFFPNINLSQVNMVITDSEGCTANYP